MSRGQTGWAALAFGAAAAMTGLHGPAPGDKAKQQVPALRDRQPGDLAANRGGCDRISLRQRVNEAGNHARRPGIRRFWVQMRVIRLVLTIQLIALCGLAAFLATIGSAAATGFSTLYSFKGGSDGTQPRAGLIMDGEGNLYGTTEYGGIQTCFGGSCGVVFELTPNQSRTAWTETILHSFCSQAGCTDGDQPEAGLVIDGAGNLYGTTEYGGNGGNGGAGTVFELTPNQSRTAWTETVLYSFCLKGGNRCTDGALPLASLIMDGAGNLYGTTINGGAGINGVEGGVVFELTPNQSKTAWTEKVLYTFCSQTNCTDGEAPIGGLTMDGAGNLYGTTYYGGKQNSACFNGSCGVVFELTPNASKTVWTETVLYNFCSQTNCTDGDQPEAGLVIDGAGNLYGTTDGGGTDCPDGGCGTVFELTPNQSRTAWTETVLHAFCPDGPQSGCTDGLFPLAGVIMDAAGNLYGTTGNGGTGADNGGLIFKMTPNQSRTAWTETVLYSFCSQTNCTDGLNPYAGMIFDASGALYGTTAVGGANNEGTVFKLSGAGTPLSENPQTSDFNADGKSDILLQNTSGQAEIWLMNGIKVTSSGSPGNPGPSWQVIGTGDFYGSLYSDILWQNISTGEVYIWEINGTKGIGGGSPGNPGPSWHVIGAGDFNGDGYADILWQNTNGQVVIWEMNGTKVIGGGVVGNPGPSWHVIGAGDFNGDGYADILFQNTNGQVVIWEMNGTKVIGGGVVGNPGTSWHVIGSGDFNGDGYSDILWQNTNGQVVIWEMNGTKVIGGGVVGNPGIGWRAIGQ
jgi:uncharacterized repeat protein (TIGR03803 family)